VARAPYRGNAIYLADENGENGQPIAPVRRETIITSSPAQGHIAFIERWQSSLNYYNTLKILTLGDIEVKTLTDEPLLAFFWAPDGKKIAYIGIDPPTQRASWKVVDIENEKIYKLTDFVPSSELSTLISFFDQYAQSHSLWSADSRYLVFTGHAESKSFSSNGKQGGNYIYVIDVYSPLSPKNVASGSMASWSRA
jgi:TolB protein